MMRRSIICFLIVGSFAGSVFAQDGITFFNGNWNALLAEAKARHLPVFVDVYTDWCGPCKRMEKEIFVKPEVGAFYNSSYVSYRLNAEKGEGPALAKRYGVKAYPTWLYLDADGTLRSRNTDYMEAPAFIETGKAALNKSTASLQLTAMAARYRKGERGTAFLRDYLELRTKFQLDNSAVMNAYLKARKSAAVTQNQLRFLLQNCGRTWSAAIPLIATHIAVMPQEERASVANEFFDQHLYFAWGDAVKNGDTKTAARAMTAAEKVYPLLTKEKQLTYNRTALYHCSKLKLKEGLKKAGYRLAAPQMSIDTNFARKQDKVLFDQVMAPFLSGKLDSTKIPVFAEEKKMAARQYSGNAASLLYETALAFADLLPPGDPALQDAAQWALRADQLAGNQHTRALVERLRTLTR